MTNCKADTEGSILHFQNLKSSAQNHYNDSFNDSSPRHHRDMSQIFPSDTEPGVAGTGSARGRTVRSRGRVRVRGRGRGKGRGVARANANAGNPSQGWKMLTSTSERLILEDTFETEVIEERARLFCTSAMERLEVQRTARQLPFSRVGHAVLFMEEILVTCQGWLNEYISLYRRETEMLSLHDMYEFVAVFLLSHCTGFSLQKTIDLLHNDGLEPPKLERVRFILGHILAFSPTGRGTDGGGTWLSWRDHTPLLSQFEMTAFRQTCKVFLSPTHTLATLDDDLYGTRALDNQVKTLSNRKADKEGHQADAIADALFRITFMLRFRRRGESEFCNVHHLVEALFEGRSEQSVHGFILTADRGYGKLKMLRELLKHGIGSIMIMPDHLLRCHPFVGKSFLSVMRHDDDDSDGEESHDSSNSNPETPSENEGMVVDTDNTSHGSSTAVRPDRPRAFVLNDDPSEGPNAWFAVKRLPTRNRGERNSKNRVKVTAVAVRERGTKKFSCIIRFIYSLPSTICSSLETWVAVPKAETLSGIIFSKRDNAGRLMRPSDDSQEHKSIVERHVLGHCEVLSLEQRCADWFILRQSSVTATSAGEILLRSGAMRAVLGFTDTEATERTLQESLQDFCKTWFSGCRSTEPMMRGTANEPAVIDSLKAKPFVKAFYSCGMISKKAEPWLACSPDGLALVDLNDDSICALRVEPRQYETEHLQLCSVEIKTSVAQASFDRALGRATGDIVTCHIGDQLFKQYIPKDHVGQIVHQMLVLSVNYLIYVSSTESGIIYTVLVHCQEEVLQSSSTVLNAVAVPVVAWAHNSGALELPTFADSNTTKLLKSRVHFWKLVNSYVSQNDAFPPLKLFKHAAQSLYSRTKGGVDGSAQARAILRSSTSSMKWEQKVVTQTLKTLSNNAFISWRMARKRDLLQSKESFQNLKHYRHVLNEVQSLADFVYDLSKELVVYSKTLRTAALETMEEEEYLRDDEIQRLCNLARRRKRRRLLFFNGTDGTALRLRVRDHVLKQKKDQQYCALCGIRGIVSNEAGWRGHRTTYKCVQCDVYLCTRNYTGFRKSCNELWHSARVLTARSTPNPSRHSLSQLRSGAVTGGMAETRRTSTRRTRRADVNEDDDPRPTIRARTS